MGRGARAESIPVKVGEFRGRSTLPMGRGHWAVPRPRVSPARSSALCCATSTAPAIILIGEMRDRETLETAISAAETDHLVLSTMHTPTVAQSRARGCEFFPAEEQIQARGAIAGSLRGFVCQKLVPKIDGYGRLPVIEILTVDATVKTLIVEVQFEKIQGPLAGSSHSASGSFNKDPYRLWKAGGHRQGADGRRKILGRKRPRRPAKAVSPRRLANRTPPQGISSC